MQKAPAIAGGECGKYLQQQEGNAASSFEGMGGTRTDIRDVNDMSINNG